MAGGKSGATNSTTTPDYKSIQVQSSALGVSISIVYGKNRVPGNLIWYNDFTKIPSNSSGKGKGGGGKGGGQSFKYQAAIILALCEGPIYGLDRIWVNNTQTDTSDSGFSLFTGDLHQDPWGYVETTHPDEALSYSLTAYVADSTADLGQAAALSNYNFEVEGLLYDPATASTTQGDVNLADVITDLLGNTNYGMGMSDASIGDVSPLYDFTQANGLWYSPVLNSDETVSDILDRWADLSFSWIFWSGTQMKYVPLSDTDATGNGATFAPNLTPIYNLTVDDFIFQSGTSPVKVTISDPSSAYNVMRLEICDRVNKSYQSSPIEAKDSTAIDQAGLLYAPTVQAHEICNTYTGSVIANYKLNYGLYTRREYSFTLGVEFILLEVGDLVTITTPNIPLTLFPVRIKSIKEDTTGSLEMVAEEYVGGIGHQALYNPVAPVSGNMPSLFVSPGPVNTPLIFEPEASVTSGTPQIWIGASGASPNWGGCDIWISPSGTGYQKVGTLTGPSTQGLLTATLPSHSDPDSTNTLAVDLTESLGVIVSGATHDDADALRTLIIVDNEVMAFGSSALGMATYNYNLTYLRRGQFNTSAASHSVGAPFCILYQGLFKYNLPKQYIGQTLHIKLQSFNIFLNAYEDLSTVTAYTYTILGTGYFINPPTGTTITTGRTTQTDGTTILQLTFDWTASPGPLLGNYEVQWSTDNFATWTGATVGPNTLSYVLKPAVSNTTYYARVRAISQNGLAQSTFATATAVATGDLVSAVPSAPTGLTVSAGPASYSASWTANTDPNVRLYQVWQVDGPSGSFGSAVQVFSGNVTSWTQPAAIASHVYTIFVVAVNAKGSSLPSTGVDVTTLPVASGTSVSIPSYRYRIPSSPEPLFRIVIKSYSLSLPLNLTTSAAQCTTAPTTDVTVSLYKNGVSFGTLTILATHTSGTFSSTAVTLADGDVLEVDPPSPTDATLKGLSLTLVGTR